MKKLLYLAGVALVATLLLGACHSSDDEDSNTNEGVSMIPTAGTDERPSWVVSSSEDLLDEWPMSVQIGIQSELLPYVSQADLMCAVVGGEVRAVSTLRTTGGQHYFMLPILGNSGEGFVTLKYYCDKLHRIFTVNEWKEFDSSIQPTDQGTPYVVPFFTGN